MVGGVLESLSWFKPGFGTLLESLSWCKPGVRHSPRVTVVVPTVGLADWVGLPNPHSCRYCVTNPGFDVLLESLSWFKPGGKLSVANGCVCYHPCCKDSGFRLGSRTGGKVTCRNSMRPPDSTRCSCVVNTRAVTTRVGVLGWWGSSSRASSDYSPTGLPSGLKPELQLHSPPSQGGIVLGCMRVVRATS